MEMIWKDWLPTGALQLTQLTEPWLDTLTPVSIIGTFDTWTLVSNWCPSTPPLTPNSPQS